MWGSGGRQAFVQGLGGSVVEVVIGGWSTCALMVKGASMVEGQDRVRTGPGRGLLWA
jgi:hypothetical protein